MDRSLPGSSVHGILQARILEWVALPSTLFKCHFAEFPSLSKEWIYLTHQLSKSSPNPAPPRTLLNDPTKLWVPRTQVNISSTLVWIACPFPRSFTRVNYVPPITHSNSRRVPLVLREKKRGKNKKEGRGEREKRKKAKRNRLRAVWYPHTHILCPECAHYYHYKEKIRQVEGDQKV